MSEMIKGVITILVVYALILALAIVAVEHRKQQARPPAQAQETKP